VFGVENLKKIGKYVKKVDFWPDLLKIGDCHGKVKNHWHTVNISRYP